MNEDNDMTIQDFIEQHGIKVEADRTDEVNPFWPGAGNHYTVTVSGGEGSRESMTIHFSTGTGWKRSPEAADVLSCLALDAVTIENASSFEEWCDDLGFDPWDDREDSVRRYEATENQTKELKELVGDTAFETLLWECEPY